MKIGLVSCSKTSRNYPCSANTMYSRSTLFVKAFNYCLKNYDRTYILSTKYGLIFPGTVIQSYDEDLSKKSRDEQIDWSNRLFRQILHEFGREWIQHHYYFHTGEAYRKYIMLSLVNRYCPVEGMRIGERLKFYNEH